MMFLDTLSPIPIDLVGLIGLCIVSVLFFLLAPFQRSQFPLVNEKRPFEFRPLHAQQRYLQNAKQIIEAGLSKADIFRVVSDNGIKTILAPKYADELRSHPALSFGGSVAKEFHSNVRGFEPFKQGTSSDEIFQYAVRVKLTQSLGNVTEPLSSETALVLENAWTNETEWHDINLRPSLLNMVAQLSSKVFLGDKICRNPDWLRITVNYTVDSFIAAQELRFWPAPLRPIVAHFLPSCSKIRQEIQQAREIIEPVLEERRKAKEAEASTGAPRERYVDAMQWMEDSAKGARYDPAVAQLSFSIAAIHTTSDMLNQVLVDICGEDQLIQELREEVISVIKQDGWKKTTLYKLKLMDSVLKESQRLKPIGIAAMRRYAAQDVKLSDGTTLPRGTNLLVSNMRMWDANVYPDPDTFDPYRFLKLREIPGHETSAQVASPSPEHMGFGFGKHACPGRFFAVNEIKVALCHILLKYDLRPAEGYTPMKIAKGVSLNADPRARISVRRRKEEITL